ncbi:aromatic prenyltransferase [Nocardia noduli]|uniref:aromatic prenyltransferase n=1 Tax=Nocardia noduli TaxID=2815722 RepID=UPI001C21725C|nr:aromatic prenyltransferase [Nocardia noduli]
MDKSWFVGVDRFQRDLKEFARSVEVRYDASVLEPILDALGDRVADTWPAVRTTTHPVPQRAVNVRLNNFAFAAQPARILREAGLLSFTGHPIERVLAEVSATLPVLWGVDIGVAAGVQKIWMLFPETIGIRQLLRFPAIPEAIHGHAEHLTHYGDRVAILGLDFLSHTMNVYSQVLAPGTLTGDDIRAALAELDLVSATEDELRVLGQSFNIYRTFSWDSPRIQRVCFPVRCSRENFPTHLHPVLERFVDGAPYAGAGAQRFNFYAAYGADDRYYKVQADYTSPDGATLPDRKTPEMIQAATYPDGR